MPAIHRALISPMYIAYRRAHEAELTPPVLILLPGLDGTGDLFANFLPELPPDLKVKLAAYPSRKFMPLYPELVSWLADFVPKNEPYVLFGESYGSPLAAFRWGAAASIWPD